MVLYLETKGGNRYVIHEDGAIERTDVFLEVPESWKMMGVQGGRTFVPLHRITREWLAANDVKKFTVCDWDHGTMRQWGDTLSRVWVYDKVEDTNYYKYNREQLKKQAYCPPTR